MEDRRRQTTEQEVRRPLTRVYPFDPLTITGTTTGTADTFFTVPDGVIIEVKHLYVCNVAAGLETLSIHVIPSGGTIGATNLVLDVLGLAGNEALKIDKMIGDVWVAGDVVKVFAGSANDLNLRGWGTEYR